MKADRSMAMMGWGAISIAMFSGVCAGAQQSDARSAAALNGQEPASFLTDYSRLKPAPDNPFDELYIAASAGLVKYNALMIDQPEIFIHPASKYRGTKPDDLRAIANGLRYAVVKELTDAYQIVDKPGPTVLLVRLAVGDLMLQKSARPVLAYTPMVSRDVEGSRAALNELVARIDFEDVKIEAEVLDSQSGQQLAALTAGRGSLSTSSGKVGWTQLEGIFSVLGKRMRCRLDNARASSQKTQQNCGAIGLAPAAAAGASKVSAQKP